LIGVGRKTTAPPKTEELDRLGWIGLSLAIASAGIYVSGRFIHPGWIDPSSAPISYSVGLIGAALAGLALFLLPGRTLDVALVLQVIAGLFISVSENALPRPGGALTGVSSIVVWVLVCAVAVPAPFSKSLLTSLVIAASGPVGLALQVLFVNARAPAGPMWIALFAPNFLMAIGAALLGRFIYHLGAQVKESREFAGYELVSKIGSGGMGEVWKARHRLINRDAAVKLIRPTAASSSSKAMLLQRFEREAQATASLHSPHTVSLYGYGVTDDGQMYYVMEHLNGFDLQSVVEASGPMPAPRVLHVLAQVCESLTEAHEAGLVHRDIKPHNILLCRLGASLDFVKVLDFGLVRYADVARTPLTIDVAVGSPTCMSPEVAQGKPGDARSDIYGLGCVAYFLLTGKVVFEARTPIEMLQKHLSEQPKRPSLAVPKELEDIMMRCLEKDPDARPQSAKALAMALAKCPERYGWRLADAEAWWDAQ
jgi:serine/threonine-protein kinase